MTTDKRTTLRPAQAASYLGCSTATLWRWAKTLDDFPQPHRLSGQRITFWYKDELDAWQKARGIRQKETFDLALHCSDTVLSNLPRDYREGHPFISSFLLIGGSLSLLAFETGIQKSRLKLLVQDPWAIEDDELVPLFAAAAAPILHKERELAKRIQEEPEYGDTPEFKETAKTLNMAHFLVFGKTLIDHLLKEGRDDGTA